MISQTIGRVAEEGGRLVRERGATAGSPGEDTGRTAEHGRPADVRGGHLQHRGPVTATVNRRQLPRTNIITNAITLLLLPLPYHRNACVDNRLLNVNHERRCEELSGRNRRTERGRRVPSGGRRNLCRRVSGADNMCGTLLAASSWCLLYCRRDQMLYAAAEETRESGPASFHCCAFACVCKCVCSLSPHYFHSPVGNLHLFKSLYLSEVPRSVRFTLRPSFVLILVSTPLQSV